MNIESELCIKLRKRDRQVADVTLSPARSVNAAALFKEKSINEALPLLATLYRVCGVAHHQAGLSAWQRATGQAVLKETSHAARVRQILSQLEVVREHLWQCLAVWPKLSGEPVMSLASLNALAVLRPDVAVLDRVGGRLQGFMIDHALGVQLAEWDAIETVEQLNEWAACRQTPAAAFINYLIQNRWQSVGVPRERGAVVAELPWIPDDALAGRFASSQRQLFVETPTWDCSCYETNAYTRQRCAPLVAAVIQEHGGGLLARSVARLVEMVELLKQSRATVEKFYLTNAVTKEACIEGVNGSGSGVGVSEAARGRLIHWLYQERGVIKDYAVVTPTQWNFHPQGVAVAGLKSLDAENEQQLRRQVALWINAIDPCGGYRLEVCHA